MLAIRSATRPWRQLRWTQRSLTTTTPTTTRFQSQSQSHPLSLGYVAGLQSFGPTAPFPDFEEAYELLKDVEPEVLLDFENDLWSNQRQKVVWSSKQVSVIDTEGPETRPDGVPVATRSLILNERPHLIQSSVEISAIGAAGPSNFGAPPPLTGAMGTHVGGLALAVPLWLCRFTSTATSRRSPRVAIIGAGGCTLPSVLANLGALVTAVEPNDEVREAALGCFGVSDERFHLVPGLGEDYLREEALLDVLIIDAEDGAAPPQAMRERAFWADVVAPSLSPAAVVAVNCIGEEEEKVELRRTVESALLRHSVWVCDVPAEAGVSARHSLLFATPEECNLNVLEKAMEAGYVADGHLWLGKVKEATCHIIG